MILFGEKNIGAYDTLVHTDVDDLRLCLWLPDCVALSLEPWQKLALIMHLYAKPRESTKQSDIVRPDLQMKQP